MIRPLLAFVLLAGVLGAQAARADALDAVFYAIDGRDGRVVARNGERVDERFPPYSTFKIPNLLIALDTGAAKGIDHPRRWDPVRRPAAPFWPKEWAQDQTLASAFRHSAVWYFRDVAREIGAERYRATLARWRYGNALVPDGSDDFWLDGSLTISPREQVDFLRRLLAGELGVSAPALAALKDVAALKSRDGYVLRAKTGGGRVARAGANTPFEGWLVGWVERPDAAPVVFALGIRGPTFAAIRDARREAAERLLKDAGALPKDW